MHKSGIQVYVQGDRPRASRMPAKGGTTVAALQKMIKEQRRAEEERQRLEEEWRLQIEEEERLAARDEARLAAEREAKRVNREQLRRRGQLLTRKQKEAMARRERQLQVMLAAGVQVAGLASSSPNQRSPTSQETPTARSPEPADSTAAAAALPEDDLRSPICCILGHVDVGKTLLLDKIRQTSVQAGEAGGITQQIGATYFPAEAIQKKTASINTKGRMSIKVPGLLIIDTPGHESFRNLRSRGSSLCNIAILVVDIMHGLGPQTLESLRLLRDRKVPFIVALNKVDRIFDWRARPDGPFRDSLKLQTAAAQSEFDARATRVMTEFAEQGFNARLYYKNEDIQHYVSLVPVSAVTGEGIPDLLALLVSLTQIHMSSELVFQPRLECTVLEVKVSVGLGTTIDVMLSNGMLHEGDRIVLCGLDGPIATNIRAILAPKPMRELRVKSVYDHHKDVKAAMGARVCAPGLRQAVAGSRVLVVGPGDDEKALMSEVMGDVKLVQGLVEKASRGVWVQASTLGSLEALLEFLRASNVPVFGTKLGPVHRRDVKAASVMLKKAPEVAAMLCFDVKVEREALSMAKGIGLKVIAGDIIYRIFEEYKAHVMSIVEQKKQDSAASTVFPCMLKMAGPEAAFNKSDPLILGVKVLDGQLRLGTPLCVVRRHPETRVPVVIKLGKVARIEVNQRPTPVVRKGDATVRIEHAPYESPRVFGRHFDHTDRIYSLITRADIEALKEHFRSDLAKTDWALVSALKRTLGIF